MHVPVGKKLTIALEELCLPYTFHKVTFDHVKDDWFTAISPNGKIPALAINAPAEGEAGRPELTLMESGAIMTYLGKLGDGKLMGGGDLAAEAKIQQWLYWVNAGVGALGWSRRAPRAFCFDVVVVAMSPSARCAGCWSVVALLELARHVSGFSAHMDALRASPFELVRMATCCVFLHWFVSFCPIRLCCTSGPMFGQAGHFRGLDDDHPAKEYGLKRYKEEAARLMSVLDKQLATAGPYMAGKELSMADLAGWPWISAGVKMGMVDGSAFPAITKWVDLVGEREGVKKGLAVFE